MCNHELKWDKFKNFAFIFVDLPNVKVVIKDLKNVFPNLKQNSTVVFLKKQLNPTNFATDAAASQPSTGRSGIVFE